MFSRLIDSLLRHRPLVCVALIAVTWAATFVAMRIRFDFTPQALFASQSTLFAELDDFRRTFGDDGRVVLVALEAVGPDDVLSPVALTWQAEIARDLRQVSGVRSVASLPDVQVLELRLAGGLDFQPAPLVQELPVDTDTADSVRERISQLPLVEGTLVNPRRTAAGVPIFLEPQVQNVSDVQRVVREIRERLDGRPPPEGYRIYVGGLPVIRATTIDRLRNDQRGLLPLAGLVYLVAMILMFRRPSGAVLPLLAAGMGLACTFAALELAGQTLNLISNVLPVLLLIIGISTSVHFVSAYSEESEAHPDDRLEATRRVLKHTARASGVATLTTMFGFASLMTARSTAIREFGMHAMLGIGLLWVAVVVVLGTLFPWFKAPAQGRDASPLIRLASRGAALAGHFVALHPLGALTVCGLIALTSLAVGLRVPANSYVMETYGESHPSVQTLRFLERELSGVLPLEISLTADRPGRFLEPDVFRDVAAAQRNAARLDGVLLAHSYVDLHSLALTRWAKTDESPASDDKLRDRLGRSDRLVRRLSGGANYRRYLTDDGRRARIMLRTRDVGTRRLMEIIQDLRADLAARFPPGCGVTWSLTGDGYVGTLALDALIRDLFTSLLTASLAIFGMIALQFRSLRVGLIAALPNLTPLALTLGYMALRGYEMNVGNVIVFTISLGFADDTTVHFLYRFREEFEKSSGVLEAIDRTFAGVGRAILQTSLLISAGLCVILFSEFLPTRRFGELTLVTLIGNLLGVLLILPACLVLFWKRRPGAVQTSFNPEPAATGAPPHAPPSPLAQG